MDLTARENREYGVNPLPALGENPPYAGSEDFRLVLYGQICESWRALIDVRFKLLALVPTVSGFGISKILEAGSGPSPVSRTGLAIIGLIATIGLLIYDLRNSGLHDELISRGRRIEDELRVDTGLFRGRPKSPNWLIKHDRATAIIYGVSILGWLFAAIMAWTRA